MRELTANPSTVEVGESSTVTVTVAAQGVTPSGMVSLSDGGQAVGQPVALVDGKATFVVGPYAEASTRTFAASYAGSQTVAASAGTGSLVVEEPEPVASTTTVTANPSTVEVGESSTVTVTVAAQGVTPSGVDEAGRGDPDRLLRRR